MSGSGFLRLVSGYWVARTTREQVLLAALAALLCIAVIWFGVLSPALSFRAQSRAGLEAAMSRHLAIVAGIEDYRRLHAAGGETGRSDAALRTLVGERAREAGLIISRVQPLENGQLSVWADSVREDVLMGFLIDLNETEGVRVLRMSLDREGDGVVRAQMLLTRAGG